MTEKLEILIRLIKNMICEKKSAQIRVNLHKGNLSEKVEIKKTVNLN